MTRIAAQRAGEPALLIVSILAALVAIPAHAQLAFTAGDLVVSVEGDGSNTGTYGDNQAAPLTLDQFSVNGTTSATAAGSLMLPQTTVGNQSAISGEYGSSSEGGLQLSGNGEYLTIMGYGVNANTFNTGGAAVYGTTALAQSQSSQVARVVALISADGSVDTSTAITDVFNGNNPRSVYTTDGTSFYVSGQGTSGDNTGGVFYATRGSSTATSITGNDAGTNASQDTRFVTAYNGRLYVSVDSKTGSTNRDYIGTLGAAGSLPTSLANGGAGPTQLAGFGASSGKGGVTIANGDGNGLNTGQSINLSPENYFFANATTLYVADSGAPKNTAGSTSTVGDGGLQKWTFNGSSWVLDYTLASGLNLVSNVTNTTGTSGLQGLTGKVVGSTVQLFATNYTLADLDSTFLYGITDSLAATAASQVTGESFTELAAAPADSNFKGVSFAPTPAVPELSTVWMAVSGLGFFGLWARRKSAEPA